MAAYRHTPRTTLTDPHSATTTHDLTQTHWVTNNSHGNSLTTNSFFTLRQTWSFEYLSQTHTVMGNSHQRQQPHPHTDSIKDNSHRHGLSKKTASCSNTDPSSQATFPDTHSPPLSFSHELQGPTLRQQPQSRPQTSPQTAFRHTQTTDTTILRPASFHTTFTWVCVHTLTVVVRVVVSASETSPPQHSLWHGL